MKRHSKKIGSNKRGSAISNALSMPVFAASGTTGLLILVAGCFLLISAWQPQALSGARSGFADALAPVLNVVSMPVQKAAIFVRDVTGLAALQAENARLAEENLKLREWYQTALLLEAENKSLKELMNVKLEPQNTYITARILSDSASTFAKSLLISAGAKDGVRKGQAVIAGDGLIGRVVETGATTARVLLITDINSRVPILIENSGQHAIFSGRNQQDGVLMHVPAGSEVKAGSRIITSGIGGIFPMGLPVGRIKAVDENVVIEPFADMSRLMHVRVVNRPDDPNLHPGALNVLP